MELPVPQRAGASPMIDRLDHLVLTARDPDATTHFYTREPGALDLCFIAGQPLEAVIAHLRRWTGRSSRGRSCVPGRPGRSARSMCAIRTSI